ncbi:MAG: hypothetical protein ACP5IM_01600 [Candidatus Bathyarchaeia archaeon]
MGCDDIFVSLHRNFASFTQFMRELKTETVSIEVAGNFLASLTDKDQYRSLTFKHLRIFNRLTHVSAYVP